MEIERQHELLNKLKYHHYYHSDKEEAKPLFGLGPQETLKLINQMLDGPRVDWSQVSNLLLAPLSITAHHAATPSSRLCECCIASI
jgi:hypothetical protein